MDETARIAHFFRESPPWFADSPLYAQLCRVVAADRRLCDLVRVRRPGQAPPNILFASVHFLLRRDPTAELARWYASLTPEPRPPESVGPDFTAYCLDNADRLKSLISTRLVQTNVVRRAVALRYGLARVAEHYPGPTSLVEVGCSAGVHLRHDRYRYDLSGHLFGPADSPVTIGTQWRGAGPVPDLDSVGVHDQVLGVDLNPIDATDALEREWLRALVWPENTTQEEELSAALDIVAADPPETVTGDIVEVASAVSRRLAGRGPVVTFHSATRAHVAPDRRAAFDTAVDRIAGDRPGVTLALEETDDPRARAFTRAYGLTMRENGTRRGELLAILDPHGRWITPIGD